MGVRSDTPSALVGSKDWIHGGCICLSVVDAVTLSKWLKERAADSIGGNEECKRGTWRMTASVVAAVMVAAACGIGANHLDVVLSGSTARDSDGVMDNTNGIRSSL